MWSAKIFSIFVVVGLLMSPLAAWGQGSGADGEEERSVAELEAEFKELSKSAQAKYAAGDYEGAIADFEAAYEIKPVSNILYNIGRIHEKEGNLDEAITYYERFVGAPNVEISARQDAVNRLRTLREVRDLQGNQESDSTTGSEGESEEDVDGSVEENVEEKADAGARAPVDRTAAWVFLGIGATTLIGSGVFAVLTTTEHSNYESATDLESRRAAASRGETFGYLADGLLVTGVVTAVLGTIFWFTAGPDEPSGVAVTPSVGRDGGGVSMSWSF